MSIGDMFMLIVRWMHLVSATLWVGGSLFYFLVLRPVSRRFPDLPKGLSQGYAVEFRALVITAIVVLVATGVILAADRLTANVVGAPYAATLGVKSVLTIWMFLLVRDQRRQTKLLEPYLAKPARPPNALQKALQAVSGYNTLVILGLIVFFLSDMMKVLYEIALRP